jgi:hypothetical protein
MNISATELTLDYTGLATLIVALTGFVSAVGVILDKRSAKRSDRLEAQGEVIRADVNSNMTDANNRIEALHETVAQLTSDQRDVQDETDKQDRENPRPLS